MNIKNIAHARLRAAVDGFVKNREDFPKVTLNLAKELWRARKSFGGDDSAFGAWLTEHAGQHADRLSHQDRAALIKIGQHAKIGAAVLEKTSSRSPRSIWEREIRPQIELGLYQSGKGAEPTPRLINIQTATVEVTESEMLLRAPAYVGPDTEFPVPVVAESPQRPLLPQGVDILAVQREHFGSSVTSHLRSLAADVEIAGRKTTRTDMLDAVIEHVLGLPASEVSRITAGLDFAVVLRTQLREKSPDPEQPQPKLKLVH
jgi:hypothetical protein